MTFDPKKPVRTRDGREVRILAADIKHPRFPIVAVIVNPISGHETVGLYHSDGRIASACDTDEPDLVNIPERVERWANVYRPGEICTPFATKERANNCAEPTRSGLIKLVYEGGKLVEVTLEKDDG